MTVKKTIMAAIVAISIILLALGLAACGNNGVIRQSLEKTSSNTTEKSTGFSVEVYAR